MSNFQKRYIIAHANTFESMIQRKTTMIDLRLIAVYLSKVNPRDDTKKRVTFTLHEYAKIMDLKRYDVRIIKKSADRLLGQTACIDTPDGGFIKVVLFEYFALEKIDGIWSVTIQCTNSIAPYFFNLKKNFMTYELWNILNLSERNHQQMYRVLKQYEKMKHKTMELYALKQKLGIEENKSQEDYYIFKRDVLEKCKEALAAKTDIRFEYEPIKKGRKVHAIKFTIHKNTPPGKKPLLSEFVAEMVQESMIAQDQHDDYGSFGNGFQLSASGQDRTYSDPDVIFFAEACNNEFSEAEMNRLIDALRRKITKKSNAYDGIEFDRFHLLQTAYLEMCARPKVYNRVGYLLKILEATEPGAT